MGIGELAALCTRAKGECKSRVNRMKVAGSTHGRHSHKGWRGVAIRGVHLESSGGDSYFCCVNTRSPDEVLNVVDRHAPKATWCEKRTKTKDQDQVREDDQGPRPRTRTKTKAVDAHGRETGEVRAPTPPPPAPPTLPAPLARPASLAW